MTRTPVTYREGLTILSKITDYPWRTKELEPVGPKGWDSTPIQSVLQERFSEIVEEFKQVQKSLALRSVPVLKEKLGRQAFTFVGECRYWVWEDAVAGWRIYANNRKGMCFDVRDDAIPEQAVEAWKSFRNKAGI